MSMMDLSQRPRGEAFPASAGIGAGIRERVGMPLYDQVPTRGRQPGDFQPGMSGPPGGYAPNKNSSPLRRSSHSPNVREVQFENSFTAGRIPPHQVHGASIAAERRADMDRDYSRSRSNERMPLRSRSGNRA